MAGCGGRILGAGRGSTGSSGTTHSPQASDALSAVGIPGPQEEGWQGPGQAGLISFIPSPPFPAGFPILTQVSTHVTRALIFTVIYNWMVHTTAPRLSRHPTCLGNLSQPRRQGLPASPKPQLPRARPGLEDWNC